MAASGDLLPPAFYRRPVDAVARDLVGRHLCRDGVVLRITEVEAYGGPEDTACHSRSGRTARNAPMWEAGGCAYIYVCYGLHTMLNVVTGEAGEGCAVLVRACEPVAGLALIHERRGALDGPPLLTGPGRVAQALGLDRSFNGHLLHEPGGLELRAGAPPRALCRGIRIGIPNAAPADRDAPRRYADAASRWVARRRLLAP
jgi:DNA-3-methyladenine glycosylase